MKKPKHKSARADGRGGWPTGKRRHQDIGDWQRIRIAAAALINEHFRRGSISALALASACGVGDRSVRRWLSGEDRPPPATQEVVRQWVAEKRKAAK